MPAKIKTLWIISCFIVFFGFLFLSFQARVKEVRAQAEQDRIQKLKEKKEQAIKTGGAADQVKRIAELNEQGKYDEAIALARTIAGQNPQDAEAYIWWGIAQVKSGLRDEALPQFVKAVELNPRNPESYIYWGLILSMMGKHEEAIQKFETAVKLDPNNSNTHAYWGASLGQIGKPEESLSRLEKALALDKSNAIAYSALMDVFYNNGQYEKAWEIVFRARNANVNISQDSIDRLSRKMPERKS